MNEPIIQVNHLKKYFKTGRGLLHAVDDVTFSIAKGETIGVVGESGCGKSTLGRTILRLNEPTSGQILYQGRDLVTLSGNELKKVRPNFRTLIPASTAA